MSRRACGRLARTAAAVMVLVVAASAGGIVVHGEGWESSGSALYSALPDEVRELLPDNSEQLLSEPENNVAGISELISLGFVIRSVLGLLMPSLGSCASAFGGFCAVICISALLCAMKGSFVGSGGAALGYVGALAISLSAYNTMLSIWERMGMVLSEMSAFVSTVAPIMTGLYCAGGSISASAVSSAGLTYLLAFTEQLVSGGLYPILQICFGLTLLCGVGGRCELRSVLSFVKNTFIAVLGFAGALVCAVMAFQSQFAQSADGVLLRSVKFAVGRMVPVIGGTIGEASQAVLGGMSFLKNTVGGVGAVAVMLIFLPILCEIFVYRTAFKLMSLLSDTLGCREGAVVLDGCADILDLATALIVCCGVMILFCIMLFIKTSLAMA